MTIQILIHSSNDNHVHMSMYINYTLASGPIALRSAEAIEFLMYIHPETIRVRRDRIDDALWKKLKKFRNLELR